MAMGGEPTPGAAPAMSPQSPRGHEAAARARLQLIQRQAEDGLHLSGGAHTDLGKVFLDIIRASIKVTGKTEERDQATGPAEMMNVLTDKAAPPGAPPAPQGPGGLPPGSVPPGPGMPPGGPPQ
jgi:hypothetical protein